MYNYNTPNQQQQQQQDGSHRPPIASHPSGYQQGQPYGQQQGGPPGPPSPYMQRGPSPQPDYLNRGYSQPPSQAPPNASQGMYTPGGVSSPAGLDAGMSNMNLGPPEQQAAGYGGAARKKKARAYHALDSGYAPTDSQPAAAFSPQPMHGQESGAFVTPGFQGQMSPMIQNSQFPASPGLGFGQATALNEFNTTIKPASMTGAPGQNRIDPDQIPSVPTQRLNAQIAADAQVYPTLEKHLPPSATADFIAQDQGNSSPKFTRLTMNNLPATADLLASTALPLGLIITPLALQRPEEGLVPVLDFGDGGPPRCRRCRTYINPFMQFTHGGNKFVCNMCLFPNNEVEGDYFAPVDGGGRRVDRDVRPELSRGTVEFVVPKEYWAKEPTPQRYMFLIETSRDSVERGFVAAMAKGIKDSLFGGLEDNKDEKNDEGEEKPAVGRRLPPGCKIGLMTFDRQMNFFNLSPKLDSAQLLVMSDMEEPFVPLDEGLFVDPYQSRSQIENLLDTLPSLYANSRIPETTIIPAVTTALSALEKTGGRIICCVTTLPTLTGQGRLHMREDPAIMTGDKEKLLFKTEHQVYIKLAQKMVDNGVGMDLFMGPSTYIDVATIGHLSATTGGDIFLYPNFVLSRDESKITKDVTHLLTRESGFQALMKVRCSNGLQVQGYHGNYQQKTFASDLEMGVVDADKSVAVMFSYDGKLDAKLDAHFQSALLYTTAAGERRVRVQNVVAAVTEVGREVIRFADQDAIVTVMAKEAASKMTERDLKQIRHNLTEKTVEVLSCYRKNFAVSTPPGQLVLPESLREYSMYMLAILKCRAFRGGNVSSDMRTHAMRMIKQMPPSELLHYLYPRILPLHTLTPEQGFADPATGLLSIPQELRASFANIQEGGAYLVDNGQICLLWLHQLVSPNLLQDLFGEHVTSLQELDPFAADVLPVIDTVLNAQTRNLVAWLEGKRGVGRGIRVQLARQGMDGAEYEFASLLVEDRNNEAQSYVDWLVAVHRNVQMDVTGQRKKEDDGSDGTMGFSGLRPSYW